MRGGIRRIEYRCQEALGTPAVRGEPSLVDQEHGPAGSKAVADRSSRMTPVILKILSPHNLTARAVALLFQEVVRRTDGRLDG